MNGQVTKTLRQQATVDGVLDRRRYRYLKRQRTLEQRYGGPAGLKKAQAEWGAKADQSKGGKASPSNFKNNKELARYAGKKHKRQFQREADRQRADPAKPGAQAERQAV